MKKGLWILVLISACGFLVAAGIPGRRHVVLVVEENHSFESVITEGGMPYLKSLAEKNTLLANYYANHHPSIGNYFIMTTGQTVSTDDGFNGSFNGDSIVSQMIAANKTWKLYGDSLPRSGYVGGSRKPYVKKHVPVAYFDVVRNNDAQRMNLVPADQFANDLQSPQGLADFSMVIPNLDHDAHDGTLQEADDWLRKNIAPLLESPAFKKDGILIITFDESFKDDKAHGGGHIATVVVGPGVKEQFTDNTFYQHDSLFATLEELLGLPRLGIVQNAPVFANIFK